MNIYYCPEHLVTLDKRCDQCHVVGFMETVKKGVPIMPGRGIENSKAPTNAGVGSGEIKK